MPSSEEVASLEEYIPTRLTTFTVLKCTIIIPVAEFNLLDHLMPIIMGEKVCMHRYLFSSLYQHVLFHINFLTGLLFHVLLDVLLNSD